MSDAKMLQMLKYTPVNVNTRLITLTKTPKKSMSVKAVIFDMGGVIIPSPTPLFKKFAEKHTLSDDQMYKIFFDGGDSSLLGQFEQGKFTLQEYPLFLSDKTKKVIGVPLADEIFSVWKKHSNEFLQPFPSMISAIKQIRSVGIKTGLLTNNVFIDVNTSVMPLDRSLFDVIVESCVEGLRKPNPIIYKLILERLAVDPTEAVFLDDLGENLKNARALGVYTIKVSDQSSALNELQTVLNMTFDHTDSGTTISGTIDVKAPHHLPIDSLKEYLISKLHLNDDGKQLVLRKFKHGQSNPTYYVNCAGKEIVLRKKPPGKLLPSAHAIEREYRVMKALSEFGVPVPNMLCLCEDSSVIGTPFFLMDYVRGRVFKEVVPENISPQERTNIYKSLHNVLQQIHSVDIERSGLMDFGKQGNYMKRQISIWSAQYEASKTGSVPQMDYLMDWLPKNLPEAEKSTIVHGDFRLDNCIFDENSSKVLSILDWELSTVGDPISDLAYCCTIYHLPKDFPLIHGLSGLNLEILGIPTEEEVVKSYYAAMNITEIKKWNVYMAFSFFRMAAILQGVYKRSLSGQASSDQARHMEKYVQMMAGIASQFADKEEANKDASKVFIQNASSTIAFSVKGLSPRVQKLHADVVSFMKKEVYPLEKEIMAELREESKWKTNTLIEQLKEKARLAGLWNLFIPLETDRDCKYGAGLTNLEYAFICEEMGKVMSAPEIFNCSAPDTGNMEVLIKYGSKEQQEEWLVPLLEGKIRSCFGMTEPQVASSDATNIESSILLDGDHYVINGKKWWISGAMDPRCALCIFMGKTNPSAPKHLQQSMILVPMNTIGVKVIRPLSVFGYEDAPSGHAEIEFINVRVPKSNILNGEGRGFDIAQGRLGPGRIHHCMRLVGWSERALELMINRANSRTAFGKPLIAQGTILSNIAESRIEIEQARLLTLKAAHMMDTVGNKIAASEIAMIKVLAPRAAQRIIDRAIQVFGGAGLSADTPLAHMFAFSRVLRLADGPDEVHKQAIAKIEIQRQLARL